MQGGETMGRPIKFVNTSEYPDSVIETLARAFYDDIVADVSKEEPEVITSGSPDTL